MNLPLNTRSEASAKSGKQGTNVLSIAIIIVGGQFIIGIGKYIFDHTRGFPGEGPDKWSNEFVNLTMTT